jgi:hypothetical protein
MPNLKGTKLIDTRPNRFFDKQIVLNDRQRKAIKSGSLVQSLMSGVDLETFEVFRKHPQNLALL